MIASICDDEQSRGKSDQLPAQKKCDSVSGQNSAEHAEHEEQQLHPITGGISLIIEMF